MGVETDEGGEASAGACSQHDEFSHPSPLEIAEVGTEAQSGVCLSL